MNLARVFVNAAGLWRHDRDLWLRVAGFFFFLSALALQLFVPPPGMDAAADAKAVNAAMLGWVKANAPFLLGYLLVQTLGYATVLTLLLDRNRPAVGAAALRALRLLPGFCLAFLAMALLVWVGLSLFIVPGIYVLGRIFLTWPILVAEPERGPFGALLGAVQYSSGRGWLLALAAGTALCATYLIFAIIAVIGGAAGIEAGGVVRLVFDVVLSAAEAVSALVLALLQAAAYRGVVEARQGT